jgi:ribosomal protein S14
MIAPQRRRRGRTKAAGRCRITGKLGYSSEHQAAVALASCQLYGRAERRAYRCEHCGRWHLTHAPLAWREGAS